MIWTKTGDSHPEDRYKLSDAAYRLEHVALTYCNRLGLDGRLPKDRLHLLPLPPKSRSSKVVAELVQAHHWWDDGDAFELDDFFVDQPSREEVAAERRYNAVRQRLRYENSPAAKAQLATEVAEALVTLNNARQRRRALAASRAEAHGDTHRESQSESQGPVTTRTRSGPTRPTEGEGEGRPQRRPKVVVDNAPAGGFREWAAAILNDPKATEEAKDGARAMLALSGARLESDPVQQPPDPVTAQVSGDEGLQGPPTVSNEVDPEAAPRRSPR